MKTKLIALFLTLALTIPLSACGGGNSGARDSASNERQPSTAQTDTKPDVPGTDANVDKNGNDNTPNSGNGGDTVNDLGGTPIGETKESGDFTVTVLSIVTSAGSEFFKPEAGNTFVFIRVTVKNNSSETQAVSSILHFGDRVDGEVTDWSLSAGAAVSTLGGSTLDGDVAAGGTMDGYYYIEAPIGSKTVELSFNPGFLDTSHMITFTLDIPR